VAQRGEKCEEYQKNIRSQLILQEKLVQFESEKETMNKLYKEAGSYVVSSLCNISSELIVVSSIIL